MPIRPAVTAWAGALVLGAVACSADVVAGGSSDGTGPRCDAALTCALEACGHGAADLGTCRNR